MEKLSLADIEKIVNRLAATIDAPDGLLPTYGYTKDFAYPHIEVNKAGLHYVVIERGQELDRKTTGQIDDLLYWIFEDVTFSMACKYEVKNCVADKDCRRIIFSKQEELLGKLSGDWQRKKQDDHAHIMQKHPFDDLAGLRATYYGQLRQQGYAETDIERLAYAKYPGNQL